jgi:hypothetical protein
MRINQLPKEMKRVPTKIIWLNLSQLSSCGVSVRLKCLVFNPDGLKKARKKKALDASKKRVVPHHRKRREE